MPEARPLFTTDRTLRRLGGGSQSKYGSNLTEVLADSDNILPDTTKRTRRAPTHWNTSINEEYGLSTRGAGNTNTVHTNDVLDPSLFDFLPSWPVTTTHTGKEDDDAALAARASASTTVTTATTLPDSDECDLIVQIRGGKRTGICVDLITALRELDVPAGRMQRVQVVCDGASNTVAKRQRDVTGCNYAIKHLTALERNKVCAELAGVLKTERGDEYVQDFSQDEISAANAVHRLAQHTISLLLREKGSMRKKGKIM